MTASARVLALLIISAFPLGAHCQDGPEFGADATTRSIFVRGKFDAGAAERFEQFLDLNRIGEGQVVYLQSPGGSLQDGMKMGLIIRQRRLRTVVGVSQGIPGDCFSACAIAFVGGTHRAVPSGSRYGVHQFRYTVTPSTARQADMLVANAQAISAVLVQYFIRMGVAPELFAASAADQRIQVLSPDQLKKWRVTTDPAPVVTWSLDQTGDVLYLRGSREAIGARETIAIGCNHESLFLFGYFAAEQMGTTISSDALILGTDRFVISDRRATQQWSSGSLVVTYNLGTAYWEKLRTAQNLGATVKSSISSGFAGTILPLEVAKRDAFLERCKAVR